MTTVHMLLAVSVSFVIVISICKVALIVFLNVLLQIDLFPDFQSSHHLAILSRLFSEFCMVQKSYKL